MNNREVETLKNVSKKQSRQDYEKLKMQIVALENTDVIATSGTAEWYDSKKEDGVKDAGNLEIFR